MVLIINYDLHNPGRDYDSIVKVIESANSFTHPLGSVWFVDTNGTPAAWRNALSEAGDSNDEYFVARIHQPPQWASFNLDNEAVAWLKNSARNW